MSCCSLCGTEFGCAMADGSGELCWCTALPAALPLPGAGAACWCPACLQRHIAAQSREQDQDLPRDRSNAAAPKG